MSDVVIADNKDPQVIQKEEEYMAYIKDHIANVTKAYEKLFLPKMDDPDFILWGSKDDTNSIITVLGKWIKDHDKSKFTDEEFPQYRRNFYPTDAEKAIQDPDILKMVNENYEKACHHHYMYNAHHPEFWRWTKIAEYDRDIPYRWIICNRAHEPYNMNILSICHMICDWEAMSIHFKSNTIEWYMNNAKDEKAAMSPQTLARVDKLLLKLYPEENYMIPIASEDNEIEVK